MSYAANNFNKAIRIFVKAGLRKREWLASKYVEHICQLEITDLPDEIREQFCQFRRDMTFVKTECKLGSLKAAVNAMSESEVDEMIARILSMHEAIAQHENRMVQVHSSAASF